MSKPLVFERTFNSSASLVWAAITNRQQMEQWYFKLEEFKPEVGFIFKFWGGPDEGEKFLHMCEVLEVIPHSKLRHSWRYEGYEGNSVVTWELFENGDKTRVKLTHAGLETLPADKPEFALHNFNEGWKHILNVSLQNHLEQ